MVPSRCPRSGTASTCWRSEKSIESRSPARHGWHEPTNTAVTRYLADAGSEVIACRSRGSEFGIRKQSSAHDDHLLALELGRKVLSETPDAQALMMPGGLWHAMHAVPILEAEFGKPVLLNILSTTRAALVAAGERIQVRPDPKWGRVVSDL